MYNCYCGKPVAKPADLEMNLSDTAEWLLEQARKWADGEASVTIGGRTMRAFSGDTNTQEVLERFRNAEMEEFMQNL